MFAKLTRILYRPIEGYKSSEETCSSVCLMKTNKTVACGSKECEHICG
jgi:hypothetical protein